MKFVSVVGARPNFVKIASLVKAIRGDSRIEHVLVHTGQHYDESMSHQFFHDLEIPRPDINLDVGSGTHATQTAEILKRFEPIADEIRPDLVIVVGDVNSTIACALTAKKLGLDVAHVEAGLRSFDRTMPEEINRVLVDAIADIHFVSEPSGVLNLSREGIDPDRVFLVGNVMIDALSHRTRAEASGLRARLGLCDAAKKYALVTLHRPSNVDQPGVLLGLLDALTNLASRLPVIFPMHPRTRRCVEAAGLVDRLHQETGLHIIDPLGYLDFLNLMGHAALVITDSGGVQEETTVLGIPCLTVRHTTERPVTITEGTNQLVGDNPRKVLAAAFAILDSEPKPYQVPHFWDGRATERIVEILVAQYGLLYAQRVAAAKTKGQPMFQSPPAGAGPKPS